MLLHGVGQAQLHLAAQTWQLRCLAYDLGRARVRGIPGVRILNHALLHALQQCLSPVSSRC